MKSVEEKYKGKVQLEDGQEFENGAKNDIEPNVITFNALISAMEKGGQWKKAETFFEDMLKRGIEPDEITYSALFDALEGHGQHDCADRIFRNRPDDPLGARQMLQLTQRNEGLSNPFLEFKKQYGFELCIDLLYLSANQARVVLRCALRDLRLSGERSGQTAMVIVGKGLGSENAEARVGPAVLSMLVDELKLQACVDPNNTGCLLVTL